MSLSDDDKEFLTRLASVHALVAQGGIGAWTLDAIEALTPALQREPTADISQQQIGADRVRVAGWHSKPDPLDQIGASLRTLIKLAQQCRDELSQLRPAGRNR